MSRRCSTPERRGCNGCTLSWCLVANPDSTNHSLAPAVYVNLPSDVAVVSVVVASIVGARTNRYSKSWKETMMVMMMVMMMVVVVIVPLHKVQQAAGLISVS